MLHASELHETEAHLFLAQFYDKGVEGSLYVSFLFLYDIEHLIFLLILDSPTGKKPLNTTKNILIQEKRKQ